MNSEAGNSISVTTLMPALAQADAGLGLGWGSLLAPRSPFIRSSDHAPLSTTAPAADDLASPVPSVAASPCPSLLSSEPSGNVQAAAHQALPAPNTSTLVVPAQQQHAPCQLDARRKRSLKKTFKELIGKIKLVAQADASTAASFYDSASQPVSSSLSHDSGVHTGGAAQPPVSGGSTRSIPAVCMPLGRTPSQLDVAATAVGTGSIAASSTKPAWEADASLRIIPSALVRQATGDSESRDDCVQPSADSDWDMLGGAATGSVAGLAHFAGLSMGGLGSSMTEQSGATVPPAVGIFTDSLSMGTGTRGLGGSMTPPRLSFQSSSSNSAAVAVSMGGDPLVAHHQLPPLPEAAIPDWCGAGGAQDQRAADALPPAAASLRTATTTSPELQGARGLGGRPEQGAGWDAEPFMDLLGEMVPGAGTQTDPVQWFALESGGLPLRGGWMLGHPGATPRHAHVKPAQTAAPAVSDDARTGRPASNPDSQEDLTRRIAAIQERVAALTEEDLLNPETSRRLQSSVVGMETHSSLGGGGSSGVGGSGMPTVTEVPAPAAAQQQLGPSWSGVVSPDAAAPQFGAGDATAGRYVVGGGGITARAESLATISLACPASGVLPISATSLVSGSGSDSRGFLGSLQGRVTPGTAAILSCSPQNGTSPGTGNGGVAAGGTLNSAMHSSGGGAANRVPMLERGASSDGPLNNPMSGMIDSAEPDASPPSLSPTTELPIIRNGAVAPAVAAPLPGLGTHITLQPSHAGLAPGPTAGAAANGGGQLRVQRFSVTEALQHFTQQGGSTNGALNMRRSPSELSVQSARLPAAGAPPMVPGAPSPGMASPGLDSLEGWEHSAYTAFNNPTSQQHAMSTQNTTGGLHTSSASTASPIPAGPPPHAAAAASKEPPPMLAGPLNPAPQVTPVSAVTHLTDADVQRSLASPSWTQLASLMTQTGSTAASAPRSNGREQAVPPAKKNLPRRSQSSSVVARTGWRQSPASLLDRPQAVVVAPPVTAEPQARAPAAAKPRDVVASRVPSVSTPGLPQAPHPLPSTPTVQGNHVATVPPSATPVPLAAAPAAGARRRLPIRSGSVPVFAVSAAHGDLEPHSTLPTVSSHPYMATGGLPATRIKPATVPEDDGDVRGRVLGLLGAMGYDTTHEATVQQVIGLLASLPRGPARSQEASESNAPHPLWGLNERASSWHAEAYGSTSLLSLPHASALSQPDDAMGLRAAFAKAWGPWGADGTWSEVPTALAAAGVRRPDAQALYGDQPASNLVPGPQYGPSTRRRMSTCTMNINAACGTAPGVHTAVPAPGSNYMAYGDSRGHRRRRGDSGSGEAAPDMVLDESGRLVAVPRRCSRTSSVSASSGVDSDADDNTAMPVRLNASSRSAVVAAASYGSKGASASLPHRFKTMKRGGHRGPAMPLLSRPQLLQLVLLLGGGLVVLLNAGVMLYVLLTLRAMLGGAAPAPA